MRVTGGLLIHHSSFVPDATQKNNKNRDHKIMKNRTNTDKKIGKEKKNKTIEK